MPPRRRLDLGTIFVVRGASVEALPPSELLDGPIAIATVDRGVEIDEVLEKVSHGFSNEVGVKLTGAVLSALGAGPMPDLEGALKASLAAKHEIRLSQLRVEALHRAGLAVELSRRFFKTDHPYADGKSVYHITTATWSARRIVLRSYGETGARVELGGDVVEAMAGGGALAVEIKDGMETYLTSAAPLIFGVETMRIGRSGDGLVLLDRPSEVTMRGEDDDADPGQVVPIHDRQDADAFLDATFPESGG